MSRHIAMVACVDPTVPNASMTHLDGIARGFLSEGYEVTLFVPRPAKGRFLALDMKSGGYTIETYGYGGEVGLPRALGFLWVLPRILRQLRSGRFQLLYIRSAPVSAVLASAAKRWGGNVPIVTEHNGWIAEELISTGRPAWMARLACWLQAKDAVASDRARVVTAGIGRKLVLAGVPEDRILVAGNGTDLERFKPMPREQVLGELALPGDRLYLGFIGSLAPWHGLPVAMRAMPAILKRYPQAMLLIAGEGVERRGLEVLAAELGVSEYVRFLGHVPVDRAATVINCFDLALAPFTTPRNSSIGLSPLKIRDYAACGRAILSTDIEGIADGSNPDWISIVMPDSVEAYSAEALHLLADLTIRERLGIAARRHAEREFGWRPIARRILRDIST